MKNLNSIILVGLGLLSTVHIAAAKTYECSNNTSVIRCTCAQGTGTCGKMMKICKDKMSCTGSMCRCVADEDKLLIVEPNKYPKPYERSKLKTGSSPQIIAPSNYSRKTTPAKNTGVVTPPPRYVPKVHDHRTAQ